MTPPDIPRLRLWHSGLSDYQFESPAGAVTHSGAVQAQDFFAATWGLGLRIRNSTKGTIETAFNNGTILRVHVMRPTWHFVMPKDIRWMIELTAPRVKKLLSSSNRKLGLDDALFARSNDAITTALEGHSYLTRQELKEVLADNGIATDVQKLGHIISRAELDGLVCSGPRRGKQFTYALLDERVPEIRSLNRDESLAELARRYFASHGPARVQDFSWWSGLTDKDAKSALEMVKPGFVQLTAGGKTYLSPHEAGGEIPDPPPALLLSVFDEYTIAYRDRSAISEQRDIERMISMGNALTNVIVLDGKVAGGWHKSMKNNTIGIRLGPFHPLDDDQKEAVECQVARYGKFMGVPAVIVNEV